MSRRRQYDDDDGRRIADMSGVTQRRLFDTAPRQASERDADDGQPSKPEWENPAASMPKSDRRAFIWGALSASLLIALAFIVGLGLVILLFTLLR